MKELVCVAPDGSLEVWSEDIYNSYTAFGRHSINDIWVLDRGKMWIVVGRGANGIFLSPEFWGREVLGEL